MFDNGFLPKIRGAIIRIDDSHIFYIKELLQVWNKA